jgi:DNA-binding CsgD family transcriptional regulator
MYTECLALLHDQDDPWRVAYTHTYRALIFWVEGGQILAARRASEEGLALFRRIGDRWGLGRSLNFLGDLAIVAGREEARAMLTEALAVQREFGDRLGMARSLSSLAAIALHEGDYATARRQNLESLALLDDAGDRVTATLCLACLACVAAAEGQFQRAARLFGAADALLAALGAPRVVYRVIVVNLDRSRERTRAALDPATFAAATAEGQRMTLEEATLADDRPPVITAAVPADVRPQGTPAPPGATQATVDGLTARERDVLRLVAHGLTDAQVADQLAISPHTVHAHLRTIYGKLNVTSRSAATRLAIERGLG